jgi:hypothetical protein
MADDASSALGSPEIAGSLVNPKGLIKKVTAATAGSQIGGAVGNVTAVAIVKTKSGAFKVKTRDEVLARVPRSEVASVELDQAESCRI